MANNKFNRFQKFNRKQVFAVDSSLFREDTYFSAKDLFEYDNNESSPHTLLGFWRHDFSSDVIAAHPGMPSYKYTLGVKLAEDDYVYVNAPLYMNKDFDEIAQDKSLVAEINKGNCNICAFAYEKYADTQYGIEFC